MPPVVMLSPFWILFQADEKDYNKFLRIITSCCNASITLFIEVPLCLTKFQVTWKNTRLRRTLRDGSVSTGQMMNGEIGLRTGLRLMTPRLYNFKAYDT
jgi:hypothetical protein